MSRKMNVQKFSTSKFIGGTNYFFLKKTTYYLTQMMMY